MKRICIEEHWANKEMLGWRAEWMKRTGFPLTMDPKTTPQVLPGLPDFEKIRLPLMDESGITMQVISTGSPGIQGFPDAATAISTAKGSMMSRLKSFGSTRAALLALPHCPLKTLKRLPMNLSGQSRSLGSRGP